MKKIVLILIFYFPILLNAQSYEDPDQLAKAVAVKMSKVKKYTADVEIEVDVEFVKIDKRRARLFYEYPDKFEIKAKGIALLPKKGAEMEYLQLMNSEFTAIEEGMDTSGEIKTRKLKIIPVGSETDIVLAQVWIDEKNLRIEKMETFTKSSGSYNIDFAYSDHPFDLPDSITVKFDVKDMSLPASMTGDFESLAKKIEKKGSTKGKVVLNYSNYEVN